VIAEALGMTEGLWAVEVRKQSAVSVKLSGRKRRGSSQLEFSLFIPLSRADRSVQMGNPGGKHYILWLSRIAYLLEEIPTI